MIKKILLLFIFFFIWDTAYSHPLDISNSTFGIKNNKVNVTTYFHNFEMDYLLKTKGIEINSIDEYFDNENIIKEYIEESVKFINNGEYCKTSNFLFYEDEIYNILTDGFKVSYNILCTENINNILFEVNYFNNFPLQTNKVRLYNLNKGIDSILYKVLTPKISYIEINDLDNYIPLQKVDTDCDGLSDEDEKIYKTNPLEIDTDNDRYTDYEEVIYGRDPINFAFSPGQEYREKDVEIKCNEEQKRINSIISKSDNNLDISNFGNEYLKNILKYITNYINNSEGNLFYIFIFVYVLGIIHAIGPGHSKSLLIAYTLEKNNGYKKGIIYALIFSLTHIFDILILFLITTLAFEYFDVSKYTYYIQLISISILFIFSLYLVYKAFFYKKEEQKNTQKTLLIAFLSGLAPCSFAWSIYFLLLSLGKLSFIVPLIIALGLGILSTLIAIVILTVFIKEKSINKISSFSNNSDKISSIIIFIISLMLMYKIFNL